MQGIMLVTNASAGSNEQDALDAALAVLREHAEVEVAATEHPDELEDVVRRADGRHVVVAGGDGSLHAVLNAIARTDLLGEVCVGLVPLGTGNDFARGVDLPLDPADAARVVVAARCRPTDVLLDDTGLLVVNNVHLGVGAQASREATVWKPRLGRLGYAVGALAAGLRPRFLRVHVRVDGEELTLGDHVAQVAIGNGSSVGGGTELIPGAHPGDGRLVVIVARAVGGWRRLTYLVRLRGGTHDAMREVTRRSGRTVTVEGEPFHLVTDGEISGPHTLRTWHVQPGAVRMLLP